MPCRRRCPLLIRHICSCVQVELPELSSAAEIELEITERQLELSHAGTGYALSLPLPYPVLSEQGSAKFDKAKRVLSVTVAVAADTAPMPTWTPKAMGQTDAARAAEEVAVEVHINVVKETLAELADGFIVHGMTLEGATWSSEEQQLQLSGDIAYPLENATLSWVNRASLPDRERITVPVYLNRNRVEMLFTVDLAAPLATVPKSVWSQRGLALVAWSNSI